MKSIFILATVHAYWPDHYDSHNGLSQLGFSESDDEPSFLQTRKIVESNEDKFKGWGAHMEGFPGTQNEFGNWFDPYNRVMPKRFVGDSAEDNYYPIDKFTQNMLTKYAVEAVA